MANKKTQKLTGEELAKRWVETPLAHPRMIEISEYDSDREWDRRQKMKEATDTAHKEYREQREKRPSSYEQPLSAKQPLKPPAEQIEKGNPLVDIFLFIASCVVSFIMMCLGYQATVATILVILCTILALIAIVEKKSDA